MSNETKEEFCGACVAGAVAAIGAGTSVGMGVSNRKQQRTYKKVIFWVSISITIISIIVAIYLLNSKCKSCA